jgi:hypothetical protein
MTEPVPEPPPPLTTRAPRDPEHEASRRNVGLALALFGIFLLLAAGTVAVAFVYLAFD